MPVEVLSAAEAAERDRETIEGGVPPRALMQRAGAAAAGEIARRLRGRLGNGVVVFAGAGNNGGDAWVVARSLATAGIAVRVVEVEDARTEDARAEKGLALRVLGGGERSLAGARDDAHSGRSRAGARDDDLSAFPGSVVVDGVLGTGARGAPRGAAAGAIARIEELGARGAIVVALDVPSGLDSTTGEADHAVHADLTLTFGNVKRGHLVARGQCGRIVVLDIGFEPPGGAACPMLVDAAWVRTRIPAIGAEAHKGTRRRLAIVGGAAGMLGASVLAARAAMRSGIGMVKLVVPRDSLPLVQSAAPEALAAAWPESNDEVGDVLGDWADALVLGPGLGRSRAARLLIERVLRGTDAPALLDADALNAFEGEADELGSILAGRPALITPHAAEAGRLAGASIADVLAQRFEIVIELARCVKAAVLLKGVPTIVGAASGRRFVSAAGTPALAAAGSGDVLAGIAGTLLAQSGEPVDAGACGAWIHGRAGELASEGRGSLRGVALEDVLAALPRAWATDPPAPTYPVIAELPAVGARRARVG